MPGLVLFKRRWSVGSDDFVYPSLLEIVLRLFWLIVLTAVFCINRHEFTCEDAHLLKIYYIGLFVFLILSIIMSLVIMVNSMKGAIIETGHRKIVPLLLYLKLVFMLPECVWVLLGTYWTFGYTYHCRSILVWTVKGTVIFSWIVGGIVLILIYLVFDPLGKYQQKNRLSKRTTEGLQDYQSVAATKAWERRCKIMCCCMANKDQNKDAFTEISKLMADFFLDVDLVPTDIAAGLLLIQKQQMRADHYLNSSPIAITGKNGEHSDIIGTSSSRQPPIPKPWMTIKLMTHYMNYAAASYGWPLFMYTNMGTGLCRLLHRSRCCSCIRKQYNIVKDNPCNCHTAAILLQTGLNKDDIIYISYHNKLAEIPFYVAIDREEMKVVVSIRGTLSLEDALTDLSAAGVHIPVHGLDNCYVHSGIYKCAKYIQSILIEQQLIEKAFNAFPDATGLVITGHSLGAGAAAILAILLKPTYPDLICYSFSPPGGLLSPNASKHAQDYICSVVVGRDVIPRLAIPTINKLKLHILKVLSECKHPKYKIYFGGCLRFCCECLLKEEKIENQLLDPERQNEEAATVDTTQIHLLKDNYKDTLRTAYVNTNSVIDNVEWPMHPPGQILHIYENEDESGCCGDPSYSAVWAHADDFAEILISPNMVFDHISDVVLDSLVQLNKRKFEPPAVQDTSTQPPAFQETSTQPPAVQETSMQPPAVQETSMQPPAVQETSTQPPAVQETSMQPLVVQETSMQPLVVQETSTQPLVVQETSTQKEDTNTSYA